jgi:hypothetical protein
LTLALGATVERVRKSISGQPRRAPVHLPGHASLDEPGGIVVEPLQALLRRDRCKSQRELERVERVM